MDWQYCCAIRWLAVRIAVSAVHKCLYAGGHQSTQLHRVGLASASHTVWYVPKWPAGLSISPAEEIMCCCVDKAVIAVLCPLTGNRMYTMALYEVGIKKPWHAVWLPSGMVAVSAADPSHKVWLLSRDCRKHGSYSQLDNPRC